MNCTRDICRRPWHPAGITCTVYLHPHPLAALMQWYSEPHAASPKSLSSPQVPPILCEQRGQAGKVGGILAPQPAKPLGLFLAPLLPTPLGRTLSGERPIVLSVPSECCTGAVGGWPTAWVGVTGELFLEAAVWSWNSICWPRYWAISKWAGGQVGLSLVLLRPRNPRIMLRYVGPHKVGATSESPSQICIRIA